LTGDDDDIPGGARVGPLSAGVDVQTAELQGRREAAGIADCPGPSQAPPDDPALPAVSLPCLGGDNDVDLSTLAGPLVLNVWAQSCRPCRDEMPLFQRLHTSTDQVSVLGIDFIDLRPDKALDLAEASGVTYPSVADVEGELRSPLRLTNLPTTLFVDSDGQIVTTELGEFSSYADLTGAVERHLGVEL
jgi:thiol-disulfide isomerase/thioredoxin